jgi:iron complex outermembrane receptor protein
MKYAKSLSRIVLGASAGFVAMTIPDLSWGQVLEEVVVTAERRETALQDTPISVLAFDSDTLEAAGIDDIEYLQNISPGLKITGSRGNGNRPVFRIRGIGNTGGTGPTGDRGVGLYVDDI